MEKRTRLINDVLQGVAVSLEVTHHQRANDKQESLGVGRSSSDRSFRHPLPVCPMSDAIPSRWLWTPSADPYPTWVPWGHDASHTSFSIPQDVAGLVSIPMSVSEEIGHWETYTLPFNEAMEPNQYSDSMVPPSSWMNTVSLAAGVQQWQCSHPPVHQPRQHDNVVGVPAVTRPVVGTPAIIASSERRRKRPRKHSCHVCGYMFTSTANRDRHVRAHYGIKPSICTCGTGFSTNADLSRHRKGRRCQLPKSSK
ncbi:hypothetical protein AB1N83_007203 [Pleurotus pulmonarius]